MLGVRIPAEPAPTRCVETDAFGVPVRLYVPSLLSPQFTSTKVNPRLDEELGLIGLSHESGAQEMALLVAYLTVRRVGKGALFSVPRLRPGIACLLADEAGLVVPHFSIYPNIALLVRLIRPIFSFRLQEGATGTKPWLALQLPTTADTGTLAQRILLSLRLWASARAPL